MNFCAPPPTLQVWLLLLPVKIFCCPVGFMLQLVVDVFEWMVKAPLRAMLYASGKPWQPVPHSHAAPHEDKH